jgi:hypothetical protein
MKTWYRAVCDNHGEAIHCFVSNIACTTAYLLEHDKEINDWFSTHYGCALRMIHDDYDLDKLWNEGYARVNGSGAGLLKRV